MINFEIFLPNKDPFQIENHVQRIHLYILYVHKKKRFKTFNSKFFSLIFLDNPMENWRKCIIFGTIEFCKRQM